MGILVTSPAGKDMADSLSNHPSFHVAGHGRDEVLVCHLHAGETVLDMGYYTILIPGDKRYALLNWS